MKTFLRAWRSRSRFKGDEEAALKWLLRLARNLVIDHRRWKSNKPIDIDFDTQIISATGKTPEEMVFQKEQIKILWDILEALPSLQRELIVLCYILGWRVKDISEHTGMSENHISVTLRRILNQIKKLMA